MNRVLRLVLVACIVLLMLAPLAVSAMAQSDRMVCTAGSTIYTTSTGTVRTAGQVTHYADSGVAGMYTSGFLSGYTFTGAQDIVVNNVTNQSELKGWYSATGPGGAFTVRYTGQVDLNTGASTGNFITSDGTGEFAGFRWTGDIAAQLVSLTPPTFLAMASGKCHLAP